MLCGSIFAQNGSDKYGTHWPDFDYRIYGDHAPAVAFLKVDDNFVAVSDNWAAIEVAAFVGNECRGRAFMNDYTGDGDPYPIVELEIFYDGNGGEAVSFKMYDHVSGIEYDNCFVNKQGSPITVQTGVDYTEVYFGKNDSAVVLSFTGPDNTDDWFDRIQSANKP